MHELTGFEHLANLYALALPRLTIFTLSHLFIVYWLICYNI